MKDTETIIKDAINKAYNQAVDNCLENVRKIWVQDGTDQEKVLAEVESQIIKCYVGKDIR